MSRNLRISLMLLLAAALVGYAEPLPQSGDQSTAARPSDPKPDDNSTAAQQPDSTPRLRIEPEKHFAPIKRIDVDTAERFVVSASNDKTARVWDLRNGKLIQVLRPPLGDGGEGKLYAVAISPDGEQIAAAGWTGYEWDGDHSVYLFNRSSGALQGRLRDLPNVINHLAFSPRGDKLVVALGAGHGIRLYATRTWQALARDSDYGDASYSVDFDSQGRLLSTSDDGYVRLYDAKLKLLHKQKTAGGEHPFFARFSPDGKQVAVGFADSTAVQILSGDDLRPLSMVDTQGINGELGIVAWSQDGSRLYAGGRYHDGKGSPLVVWEKAGTGQRTLWRASQSTVMAIQPLKDGSVIYASADPATGRLDARGQVVWKQHSGVLSFRWRKNRRQLGLSKDGGSVSFHYARESEQGEVKRAQALWRLADLHLGQPSAQQPLQLPRHQAPGVDITDWENEYDPKLNGQPLPLEAYEMSRSLAIDAQGEAFALGTEWSVRLYDKAGKLRWQQAVSVAWAVNISADNRWVVAALGDGTLRWYERDSGTERLAFYLHPDEKRWIAWTPQGFYAAAEGAEALIGYHLNQGADQAAEFVRVDRLRELFARADLVAQALAADYPQLARAALRQAGDVREILRAGLPPAIEIIGGRAFDLNRPSFELQLSLHDRGGGFGRVEYRVNGEVVTSALARPLAPRAPAGQRAYKRPFTLANGRHLIEVIAYSANNQVASEAVGVRVNIDDPVQRAPSLYVLSIGVTDYRDNSFDLKYAAADAADFAAILQHQGRGLFQRVEAKVLADRQVSLAAIRAAFEAMAVQVQPQDVFLLYLAGHGMVLDGRYHYVPHDAIYENDQLMRRRTLGEERLREWLALVQAGKRVMVIDTCHAGRALPRLAALELPVRRGVEDKAAIARLMQATGTSVLAAASDKQQALAGVVENGQGRGLFTHVLLQGLRGGADIIEQDGYINVEELSAYARREVPRLAQQHWQYEQFPMFQLTGHDFPITRARR